MTFIYINIQSFVTSNMFPSFLIKSWEFIYYSMFYFLSFIPIFYIKVLGVSPLNFVFYTSIRSYFFITVPFHIHIHLFLIPFINFLGFSVYFVSSSYFMSTDSRALSWRVFSLIFSLILI